MHIATESFGIITAADIERVWETLTPPGGRVPHLYGLAVESLWTPDSTITLTAPDGQTLAGIVVVASRPRRLSYTLGEHADEPCAYVNWELQRDPAGTAIRLCIDEIDPAGDVAEALRAAWLPALAALQEQLDAAPV
jgi:uncharacterized protein YndB with AHSA1/START domain